MDETFRVGLLFQVYASFLTENQQRLMHAYYYEDLSLQEIGNNLSISKQAVSSQLRRAVKKLNRMEKQLKVLEKRLIVSQDMAAVLDQMEETLSMEEGEEREKRLSKELDQLKAIRLKLIDEESESEHV